MRKRFISTLVSMLALAGPSALAQGAPDAEPQRQLVQQKIKLVDMLVNSPRALAPGNDPESAALVERARQLLKQAREALAAERYELAAPALDEALQSISKANKRNAGGLSDSVQKQHLQEMGEQVSSYRSALAELIELKGAGAASARAALQQVDALAEEGRKLAAAGHLGDANKKMAQAYKLEVEAIARLRAGQEVVLALTFATPADEYAYEQKRFHANDILVGMMIAERRVEGDTRRMVDGFVGEALRLKEAAAAQARSNHHAEAVTTMEKAAVQLNRALQTMGLPAF